MTLNDVVKQVECGVCPYYIYLMYKPDGTAFYVGKGKVRRKKKDQRITYHEREARSNGSWTRHYALNHLKLNIIRKIWRNNEQVGYDIDSSHLTEASANKREIQLIAQIGRRIMDEGPLANLSEGGGGFNKSEETKKQISDGLKKYYKEHPDVRKVMSEAGKRRFDDPASREHMRQQSIKNNTAENLAEWQRDHPDEVAAQHANHSGLMKNWYLAHQEEAEALAARRNTVLRGQDHREKMSAATTKFRRENPGADLERLAKVKERLLSKRAIYDQCLTIIHARLVAAGHARKDTEPSNKMLYEWRQRGLVTDMPSGKASLAELQRYLAELQGRTVDSCRFS